MRAERAPPLATLSWVGLNLNLAGAPRAVAGRRLAAPRAALAGARGRRRPVRRLLAAAAAAREAGAPSARPPELCGGVPPLWEDVAQSPYNRAVWEEDGVVLGQGAFGVVARGMNKDTGELVAIKRIAPTHELAIRTARNEIDAANALGVHPNVVQLKAYFMEEPVTDSKGVHRDMVLMYRLALGGDLQQWVLAQHGNSFSAVNFARPKLTDESLRLMLQLIAGLEHCHSKGVQHRDLKPANILLSAGGTALIGDFGIALVNRSSGREQGQSALGDFYFMDVGSLVVKQLPYTLEDDIYSLGEVFVRILYGNYATGSELNYFIKSQTEAGGEPPPAVTQILATMLRPRETRASLAEVRGRLAKLAFMPLTSEPRPILTAAFLGVGAVATAALFAEKTRRDSLRRASSVFSSRSKLRAEFRVGRAQATRVFMEDYYCHCRVPFSTSPDARSWRLLGVFDGHGGTDCARFAARFLPHEVRRMFRQAEEQEWAKERGPGQAPSAETLRVAARALRMALESLNNLFVEHVKKNRSKDAFGYAGTTAVTALLSPEGRHAVICNIGDSRAALAGGWRVTEHSGNAPTVFEDGVVLSHPHNPGDPSEMERIEAAGGFVELGRSGYRVNGALSVSRALGYAGVREFAETVTSSADYIIAERADVDHADDASGASYPALVALASDGAFEGLPQVDGKPLPHEVARVIRRLAAAQDGADLEVRIQAELDAAGGGPGMADQNKDNATILACLLPAAV